MVISWNLLQELFGSNALGRKIHVPSPVCCVDAQGRHGSEEAPCWSCKESIKLPHKAGLTTVCDVISPELVHAVGWLRGSRQSEVVCVRLPSCLFVSFMLRVTTRRHMEHVEHFHLIHRSVETHRFKNRVLPLARSWVEETFLKKSVQYCQHTRPY